MIPPFDHYCPFSDCEKLHDFARHHFQEVKEVIVYDFWGFWGTIRWAILLIPSEYHIECNCFFCLDKREIG